MKTPAKWTVAIFFAATACGCNKSELPTESPRPVKVQAVQEHTETPLLRYSANIAPYEQVPLAFKVGGYVSEIRQVRGTNGRMRNVQQGDAVTRGMVLARVRQADYVANVDQARASLAAVQAGFDKSKLDWERAQRLFEKESLTKPDLDAARAAYDSSKAQADGAKAQLELAETALRDSTLVSPLDGVVLERKIENGVLVGQGSVGFIVADTTSVKAVFGVPDALMRQARLGFPIPITTEIYGAREFPGKITAISPSADPTSRVFGVELTVRNSEGLLKPGMIATAQVPQLNAGQSQGKPVLVVPLNAIVRPAASEGFAVFVVESQEGKEIARRRAVQVGEVYGNQVSVRQGVKLGERVIESGATLVRDGEVVRVIQ